VNTACSETRNVVFEAFYENDKLDGPTIAPKPKTGTENTGSCKARSAIFAFFYENGKCDGLEKSQKSTSWLL
jgi:hypothetical protein